MGKKRKPELDLDHEQNMHGSFVAAANSLSQLYTKAVQQHKRAHTNGARHVLVRLNSCNASQKSPVSVPETACSTPFAMQERQIQWVLRDYASNSIESIPVNVLLKFLQQEMEVGWTPTKPPDVLLRTW